MDALFATIPPSQVFGLGVFAGSLGAWLLITYIRKHRGP